LQLLTVLSLKQFASEQLESQEIKLESKCRKCTPSQRNLGQRCDLSREFELALINANVLVHVKPDVTFWSLYTIGRPISWSFFYHLIYYVFHLICNFEPTMWF